MILKQNAVAIAIVLACLGGTRGPATRPASRPATAPAPAALPADAKALRTLALDVAVVLERARTEAVRRMEGSSEYRDLMGELAEAQEAKDAARTARARQVVARLKVDTLTNDQAVKDALAAKARVEAALAQAVEAEKRAAAQREASDPIKVAIKAGRFVKGMTEAQVNEVMGQWSEVGTKRSVEQRADGSKLIRWTPAATPRPRRTRP